jgi:hypothetical protein
MRRTKAFPAIAEWRREFEFEREVCGRSARPPSTLYAARKRTKADWLARLQPHDFCFPTRSLVDEYVHTASGVAMLHAARQPRVEATPVGSEVYLMRFHSLNSAHTPNGPN